MSERPISRRAFLRLVGAAAVGAAAVGAAAEGLTPGGVVRRAINLFSSGLKVEDQTFEDQRVAYLRELQEKGVEELMSDINNRRQSDGLKPLQVDHRLRELAQYSANAAAQIPPIVGDNARLRTLAEMPEQFLEEAGSLGEAFTDMTVAADSVVGIERTGFGTDRNQYPLIYSFEGNDAVPITPILSKDNLDSIGAAVALDDLGNRIIFIVAAETAR